MIYKLCPVTSTIKTLYQVLSVKLQIRIIKCCTDSRCGYMSFVIVLPTLVI